MRGSLGELKSLCEPELQARVYTKTFEFSQTPSLNVIYASTREKFKYFLLSVDKQMSPVPLKRNTVPVLCACACTYAFACIIHVNQLLI